MEIKKYNEDFVVPRVIETTAFLKERVDLLKDIYDAIGSKVAGDVKPNMPRTIMQRLPRHMRRRAMSHNVKRLPRNMRGFGMMSLAKTKHRKKAPSRFWRRRPRNLLKNYIQRQRLFRWLESHVWHAKRFAMKAVWGYKIAFKSFQKSYRAIYRSATTHSTVCDISYMRCLQITGPSQQHLIQHLAPLTAKGKLTSFGYKPALDGGQEETILLYKPESYPLNFIGPARYLWALEEKTNKICLYLWVHPSIFGKLFESLTSLFDLIYVESETKETKPLSFEDFDRLSNSPQPNQFKGTQNINVTDMSDVLDRFRLCGPRALNVLSRSVVERSSHSTFQTIANLTPGNLPKNKVYCSDVKVALNSIKIPLNPLLGGLKDSQGMVCMKVASDDKEVVSVYLVSRKTKCDGQRSAFDGVDVVVPRQGSRLLWRNIQMASGHVSGLHSLNHLTFEGRQFVFPDDVPDSLISGVESKKELIELTAQYEKRPWNRRKQFWSKFSIKYPFTFEWERLVGEWQHLNKHPLTNQIFVVRERAILSMLSNWWKGKGTLADDFLSTYSSALIPIAITSQCRGLPKRFALICSIESEEDVKKGMFSFKSHQLQPLDTKESISSVRSGIDNEISEGNYDWFPVSLSEMFPSESAFKLSKAVALRKGKKEKRTRHAARQDKRRSTERIERQQKDNVMYAKSSCDRSIIGRIVRGDYSFSQGIGHAYGYVSVASLSSCHLHKKKVLFRNTNSSNYFVATMEILTSSLLDGL
uniref:Ribonucleases P/MRP protein subunit POP1 n=1 Tax=Rhabditophanes sp. KR3021 TaxID=114890 RepID=A0AC35TID3_9BILA